MVGDTVLSVRTTASAFMNSYPGVCGRRREGQMCVRATAPPSSPRCLSATTPPPVARRRLTGTPVRSRNTDGRTGDVYMRRRSLIAGRWTAHEDDDAAWLFATNIYRRRWPRGRLGFACTPPDTLPPPLVPYERHVNVLFILTLLTVLPVVR